MFNALQNEHFNALSTKDKLFALLDVAAQIIEHDATIEELTIDDDAEAFSDVRSALNTLEQAVDYYID